MWYRLRSPMAGIAEGEGTCEVQRREMELGRSDVPESRHRIARHYIHVNILLYGTSFECAAERCVRMGSVVRLARRTMERLLPQKSDEGLQVIGGDVRDGPEGHAGLRPVD